MMHCQLGFRTFVIEYRIGTGGRLGPNIHNGYDTDL